MEWAAYVMVDSRQLYWYWSTLQAYSPGFRARSNLTRVGSVPMLFVHHLIMSRLVPILGMPPSLMFQFPWYALSLHVSAAAFSKKGLYVLTR